MIERRLLSRLKESGIYNFNRVGVSQKQLFPDKAVSVEKMAQRACLSRKQFRIFFDTIGSQRNIQM